MSDVTEDFLEHFGVKGMRWGKRSDGGSSVEVAKKSKAPIDKDKLSAARKDLYKGVKQSYSGKSGKVKGGAVVAATLLGSTVGSQVLGAQMMRSAGYTKGKSFAMGFVGGAPGAALAIELKARKMSRE